MKGKHGIRRKGIGRRRMKLSTVLIAAVLGIWGIMILYPFYNVVMVSFMTQKEYVRTAFVLFPKELTLDAYKHVFSNPRIWSGYRSTLLIVAFGVPFNMFLTVTLAYALSKKDFPGKRFFNEYMEYAEQGQFKALPDDFEEKYPNLYATTKKSGIYDYIKEAMDGELYGVPRTTNAFSESKENVDYYALIYRKDWAKQLGIEVGDVISYEDFLHLAKEFVTKDLGGNGENRTIGFCGDPGAVCTPFMISQNSYYDSFGKDETGKYYAGIMEDSTLEGVKEIWRAYQDGIIDPNFFSNNADDAKNNFMAGQAGIYWQGIIPNVLLELYPKFKEANPELDPREAIGVAVLKAPDGKVHGVIMDNYWTAAVFNPDMDDVKQERILAMMDYFCTEEGVYLSNLGIEGIDWKRENGDVVVIEQTDENGEPVIPSAKYPSIGYFSYMGMCGDGFSYLNPATAKDIRETCLNVTKLKEEIGLDVKAADLDLKFFSGPEYSMYDVTASDIITEVVIEAGSEEELVELWNAEMDEIRDKTNRVLDELNTSLGN